MIMIVAGVLLWSLAHFIPTLAIPLKTEIINRAGENAFKGVMTVLIFSGLLLIIFGWRNSLPSAVYLPPPELRHVSMGLVVIAFYCLVSAGKPARINRLVRHPQLTGVAIWAFAHLLSNGELRSIILFGGMGLWAVLEIVLISRRDKEWTKPDVGPISNEIGRVFGTLVFVAIAAWAHRYYTGIPLF